MTLLIENKKINNRMPHCNVTQRNDTKRIQFLLSNLVKKSFFILLILQALFVKHYSKYPYGLNDLYLPKTKYSLNPRRNLNIFLSIY